MEESLTSPDQVKQVGSLQERNDKCLEVYLKNPK